MHKRHLRGDVLCRGSWRVELRMRAEAEGWVRSFAASLVCLIPFHRSHYCTHEGRHISIRSLLGNQTTVRDDPILKAFVDETLLDYATAAWIDECPVLFAEYEEKIHAVAEIQPPTQIASPSPATLTATLTTSSTGTAIAQAGRSMPRMLHCQCTWCDQSYICRHTAVASRLGTTTTAIAIAITVGIAIAIKLEYRPSTPFTTTSTYCSVSAQN